jgi:hypothetical protein
MQSKEEINDLIIRLKARKSELVEEQKLVEMQLAINVGKFEILSQLEQEKSIKP